jgi:RNA polymerase sigma-70 factor (ECF subfamily)
MDPGPDLDHPNRQRAYVTAWRDHRRRILDVAYRMLGSVSDAEDVVQETYARLARADLTSIEDTRGWLIAVATRLCLDELRKAKVRRRRYRGPWLPEPVVITDLGADPADIVTLDETVRMALLVLLEQLSPAERTVFVLHEVFEFGFDEISTMVDRSPVACRQLASRARRRIAAEEPGPRFETNRDEQSRLAERFADACRAGTISELLVVLDPDCTGEFDSGGLIPGAPLAARLGAATIAATLATAFKGADAIFDVYDVNGEPGVIVRAAQVIAAVISLQGVNGRVTHIQAIGNPYKLRHLEPSKPGATH